MNTYIKKLILLLPLISFHMNYGMRGQAISGIKYAAGHPIEATTRAVSYPFYKKPFSVTFYIKKPNKNDFEVKVVVSDRLESTKKDREKIADVFLNPQERSFTYSTFSEKETLFQNAVTFYREENLSGEEKIKIQQAWMQLKNSLLKNLIEDMGSVTTTITSGEQKISSPYQGYMQVDIGGYSPVSRFWSSIYNDIANFAKVVGVYMPRTEGLILGGVSATTQVLTGGPIRKVILGLVLASGLGYFTWKYWNQIPSVTDIGGGIEQAGQRVSSWGQWGQGSKPAPAKPSSPQVPTQTSIQTPTFKPTPPTARPDNFPIITPKRQAPVVPPSTSPSTTPTAGGEPLYIEPPKISQSLPSTGGSIIPPAQGTVIPQPIPGIQQPAPTQIPKTPPAPTQTPSPGPSPITTIHPRDIPGLKGTYPPKQQKPSGFGPGWLKW